jgi:hypothetical protein
VTRGWYVYGVVDADRAVDSGSLRPVRSGGLAAVTGEVDLAEFDDLDERLSDRAWVEQKALEHELVLSGLAAEGPVVPLRFGAVYRQLDDVGSMLAERHDELADDLERVRGCVELGVKGFAGREALEDVLGRERQAVPAGSPGRAYLERRLVEQDVAAEAAAMLGAAARTTHERLLRYARAGGVNRPHSRELSGREDEMFLNAAYLVPSGDDRLREEVAALNGAYAAVALSFEVTGPWPPYNFVGEAAAR